jgi:hypothetical protein
VINIGYNYAVDCDNDGNYEALGESGDFTCNYTNPGTYILRIADTSLNLTGFPRIYFNNSGDRLKILDIRQWGKFKWTSMSRAFFGAENLIASAQDSPDFGNVSSFANMFREAHHANPPTYNWNVSNITTMHWMFYRAYNANPNTANWNTSMVSFFDGMFYEAFSANPDTSAWVTSNATDMGFMFYNAISADPVTSSWDVTQVSNMSNMFKYVTLSLNNYDTLLTGFASQAVQNNINFHGGYSQYCNAFFDRADLIASKSWTIVDGGQECTPAKPPAPTQLTSPNDNTPTIQVTCAEAGNEMKIYANSFIGDTTFNPIATYTCSSTGMHNVITPQISDRDAQMYVTESKHGDESVPSNNNTLIIDSMTNAPTSVNVYPAYAHDGAGVEIQLVGLESADTTVSIVGASCYVSVLPSSSFLHICNGIVGVNGFDNSDTTITVTDIYGNVNTDAHYVLVIDNTPPTDPTSITTTPLSASNGTTVTTVLEGIEQNITVEIPGMTCVPTPADAMGTVTCTGVVGQNGLDGTDTTIRLVDLALNANLNNDTGLTVIADENIFNNGFE